MVSKKPLPTAKIKRVFWDIETSPNIVLSWRIGFKLNIGHDAIVHERKIICIGYKWEGEKKVTVIHWDKDQDDKALLKQFLLVANEADELVAHFGDRCDLPWLRTRCLLHGLDPLPAYKTVDTNTWARKNFNFNCTKLDYLSQLLGHGGKLKTGFSLWKKVLLDNDRKALAYMCKYCGVVVEKLEKVYGDLAPHSKPKTHAGVFGGLDKWTCPRTGSVNVIKSKTNVTAAGTIQHQMKSLDGGGYFTISEKAFRDYQEAKKKHKT
jgi:predicted PolB exonuclease-like 3'-5' exonuclease